MAVPVVGIGPLPTGVSSMVMDQAIGPVAVRRCQNLKAEMEAWYPGTTLKVRLMVLVPVTDAMAMACPDAPPRLVHAEAELLQEEVFRLALKVPGATVYGWVVMVVFPKLWR